MNITYIFLGLLISFLWGIQPLIHKHLLNNYSSFTIIILTNVINTLLLLFIIPTNYDIFYTDLKKFNNMDYFWIIIVTLFTIFITNLLYYDVLKNHDSSIISGIVGSSPIFTLLLASIFLKENIDFISKLGIIFVIIGVFLIAFNNST